MVVAFFDTSALIRRYFPESDAQRVRAFLGEEDNDISVSKLTLVEFASAVSRSVAEGRIDGGAGWRIENAFRLHRRRYALVDVTDREIANAEAMVRRHRLRTLDALQVAGALAVSRVATDPIQFWTADRRQAAAAEAERLEVVLLGADRR